MKVATLEDWAVIGRTTDAYKPPESASLHLVGRVFGHTEHDDGKSVITSTVMHADGKEVITRNTKYHLGKAAESYREWYFEKCNRELNEENPFD